MSESEQLCAMVDDKEVCTAYMDASMVTSTNSYRISITDFGAEQSVGGSDEERKATESVIARTLQYMNSIDDATKAKCPKNTHELCSFW